jgi:hypothetical protein
MASRPVASGMNPTDSAPMSPSRATGKLRPETKYTGSTKSWPRCQASRPHTRKRLARTMPTPYSAASVAPKTRITMSHCSTAKLTPKRLVAITRTASARVELITMPPRAIPNRIDMKCIGAAK